MHGLNSRQLFYVSHAVYSVYTVRFVIRMHQILQDPGARTVDLTVQDGWSQLA